MADSIFIWPDVFVTGVVPDGTIEEEARADAYMGWGLCMAQAEIPENFGKGMAALTVLFPSVGDIAQEIGRNA
jgi:hypothetical protein